MKKKVHYWTSKHYKCNTKTMCFENGDKQITGTEQSFKTDPCIQRKFSIGYDKRQMTKMTMRLKECI